ncbi:methyl-CpG-binding domain protein 3-like [Brevipalpus obovatus]|uniref:methyl-CpG-binding domain protein 3-like n=1 Tax=Brevipalpus obovatus TaxID=246614 RepID=UPI003D9DB498
MIHSKAMEMLPLGWRREERKRKNGLSTGKTEVFYLSPTGIKVRTKCQLAKYLGPSFDPAAFDFRTGRFNPLLSRRGRHNRNLQFDGPRRLRCGDISVSEPIRRTASIFKQPVTVIKRQTGGQTRNDNKHGISDKPRQLFWEKRLEGLKATIKGHEGNEEVELPKSVRPIESACIKPETALRSLSTCLHLHSGPITGQKGAKNLEKNPAIFLDADQPLIHVEPTLISDEDIRKQEERVYQARKKLAHAIIEHELG